jgi:hypothetical protein
MQRLRLFILSLATIKESQIVQGLSRVRVIGSQLPLSNTECLPMQ